MIIQNRNRTERGQSSREYAFLLVLILTALFAFGSWLSSNMAGEIKKTVDKVAEAGRSIN